MKNNDNGFILVTVLFLITILSILALTIGKVSMHETKRVDAMIGSIQAYYIARSGADMSAAWLIRNPQVALSVNGTTSYGQVDLGEGTYEIELTKQGDNSIRIKSTGTVGNHEEEISITLHPTESSDISSSFQHAVFSNSNISLSGSSRIDGDTGINSGSVTMGNPCLINGSLYKGEEVTVNRPENVSDGIEIMQNERVFELPTFKELPEGLSKMGTLNVGAWPVQTYTISDDGWYDAISVVGNGEIYINVGSGERYIRADSFNISQGHITLIGTGTLYILTNSSFQLGGSSTVNYQGNADLHIYVAGNNISLSGNSSINGSIYSQNANFSIIGSSSVNGNLLTGGATVQLSGSASLVGAIYAPNSNVSLSGSSEVEGGIISSSFSASGSSNVTHIPIQPGEYVLPSAISNVGNNSYRRGEWN